MSAAQTVAEWRSFDLPWGGAPEQERRFRRTLRNVLLLVLPLSALVPWLPLPERSDPGLVEPPPRMVRLLEQSRTLLPPAPVAPRDEPVAEAPGEVPTPAREEAPPAAPPPPVTEAPRPAPSPEAPAAEPSAADARERAAAAGLMPLAEQLGDLRASAAVTAVTSTAAASSADDNAPMRRRALITSRAGQSSGGLSAAELGRDTGGAGLAERQGTGVADLVGTAGGSAAAGGGAAGSSSGSAAVPGGGVPGGGARSSRSREEIERVFDRNRGAIYALYSRALRDDPSLQGRVVLRLTIAPDGTVTDCEVVESELADETLERRLVQRVLLFRFEAKDVAPVTTTKPIEFFPA